MPRWKRVLIGLIPTFVILSIGHSFYYDIFFDNDYLVVSELKTIEKKGRRKYLKMKTYTVRYRDGNVASELKFKIECKRLSEDEMECVSSQYSSDTKKWEIKDKKLVLR